jgi:superoxide dismutase, Fe-Mn family
MPTYTLPELPYDLGALEPHLSARILELHHGKHHAAYVTGANAALEKLEEARAKSDFASIAALERALAFNVSGHVLHSIFWTNMAPKAGGRPDGALGTAIDRDFGSFDAFKKQLTAAASTVMGSGWAALVWEPLAKRLLVSQIYDHQGNVANGSTPLLVLDAWEHAFYLQYENRKTEFFDAVWNLWNWPDVAKRFAAVK